MIRSMEEVCEGLLDEACYMWERDGAVITTSFAIGHARSLFAQPSTREGCQIDSQTRVHIQALMASTVGAVYLGRIDESYYTERPAEAAPLGKGDLERLAKTDPTVHTAIVVQGMNTRSGESLVFVAVSTVDDDGDQHWEVATYDNADGQLIAEATQALLLSELITIPATDAQLRGELSELGWTIADSDDISERLHDEEEEE